MKYKGIPTNTPSPENSLMHLQPHQHLGVLRLRHAVILSQAAVILSNAAVILSGADPPRSGESAESKDPQMIALR
jgi:hypothetical protein